MKVMTLNIWNYTAPWERRRRMLASLIAHHRPHVVGVQETRHDFRFYGGTGQAEQLAADTGYVPISAIAQVYIPLLRVDEGLALLCVEEPRATMLERLSRIPTERTDENRRICLGVRLLVAGHEVDVFTTHFSLGPAARLSNAREVLGFTARESGPRPSFLMGDLNALPSSPEVQLLAEVWTDVWAAKGTGPGYTYPSRGGVRRIDYIFTRNTGPVRSVSLVGNQPEDGVYPSDHLGIVAEVDL